MLAKNKRRERKNSPVCQLLTCPSILSTRKQTALRILYKLARHYYLVVLAKVKYPATKINQYVENHPEKMGETWALGQSCLLTHAKDLYKYKPTRPGPALFFSARAIQYFGIILFRCVNQSFQAKGFLSHSSRMNSALSASNGIIRGPVASSSII